MKLGLLRMSLDFRLREIPWDHGNGTRLDALRKELLCGSGGSSPLYARSRANSSTLMKNNQYLTVAKPAALTGTLQIRFVLCSDDQHLYRLGHSDSSLGNWTSAMQTRPFSYSSFCCTYHRGMARLNWLRWMVMYQ